MEYNEKYADKLPTEPLLPRWMRPSESYRKRLIDGACVALNAGSTVLIVFLNKFVLTDQQLKACQLSIAAWHFVATFAVLYLATCQPWQMFKAVKLPLLKVLPLSALFCAFLILNNLSLTTNPIGFYQLSKIMTTPAVVLINFMLFGQTVTFYKLLGILASCVGVGLVSGASIKSNILGATIAIAAFLFTACYQIWIGKKVQALDVSPTQLLLNQAPVSTMLLLPLIPFFDTMPDISLIPSQTVLALLAGGIVASLINLSQFMIIGRTSALTFNIVSMIKMVAILSLGWYTEGKIFSLYDWAGIVMALGGAWFYAFLR